VQHVSDRVARYIDGDRLWRRLMQLSEFGATSKGGVDRQALSEAEIEARKQLVQWGSDIGLEASVDCAANLFLKLAGTDESLPPVLAGSHVDSQPTGGKFVSWMNEEGSRFAPGMMGSALFTGARKIEDIQDISDKAGVTVAAALHKVLSAEAHLRRRPTGFAVGGFLEAHIEQGPILEIAGKTIGIVTGIQGKRTFRVRIDGEENHAGTSPRSSRRDALVTAVEVIHALQEAMWDREDVVRFTIGMFNVTPNAPSVVPGRVVFSIDLRHPKAEMLRELGNRIPGICQQTAGRCDVAVDELLHDPPLEFPNEIRQRLKSIADELGIPCLEMASGAGHDARHLHYVCPTGMIFIPCKNGISHNEAESASKDDITAGTRILAEALFALANTG
jgi:N-carbamoyl-L-amino-acid hydrolase